MTSGLVNASFSLPEWQAVKMIYAPLSKLSAEVWKSDNVLKKSQQQ